MMDWQVAFQWACGEEAWWAGGQGPGWPVGRRPGRAVVAGLQGGGLVGIVMWRSLPWARGSGS
jgi:hypothetical protein